MARETDTAPSHIFALAGPVTGLTRYDLSMARVAVICIYEREGVAARSVDEARADPRGGFEGDWHGARDNRQILVVDKAVLDDMGLLPGALREQVTVEGFEGLDSLSAGTILEIGSARFEVTKECAPCLTIGGYNEVDDPGAFREALEGRRGIFLKFTEDSPADSIAVGNEVKVLRLSGV